MSRVGCLGPAPAHGDPARDGALVRASFDAELGDRKVLGFVEVAFVEADRDAGALGEKVTTSGCQLGQLRESSGPALT